MEWSRIEKREHLEIILSNNVTICYIAGVKDI